MPLGSTVITKEFGAAILAILPQLREWIAELSSPAAEAKVDDADYSILSLLNDLLAVLTRLGNDRNRAALQETETEMHPDAARLVSAADVGLQKCILPRCKMSHRVAVSLMQLLITEEKAFEACDRSVLDKVILGGMRFDTSKTPFMQAMAEYYGVKPFDKLLTRKARHLSDVKTADIYGPVCVQVAHIEHYEWFSERQTARQQRQQWLAESESLLDELGAQLLLFARYAFSESLPVDVTPEILQANLIRCGLIKPEDELADVSYEAVVAAYTARMQQLYTAHDQLVPYSIDPAGFYQLLEAAERGGTGEFGFLSIIFGDVEFDPGVDTLTDFVKDAVARDKMISQQLAAINPAWSPIDVATKHYAQHYDDEVHAKTRAESEYLPMRMRSVLEAYMAHAKVVRTAEDIAAVKCLSLVIAEVAADPLDKSSAYKLVMTLYQLRYAQLVRVKQTPDAKITDSAAVLLGLQPLVHQLVNCITLQTDRQLHRAVTSGFASAAVAAPVGGSATFGLPVTPTPVVLPVEGAKHDEDGVVRLGT
ncbi:MAG: hypothetical protein P1U40_11485 [Coxiellaceae bacterium]|nr:hypothetical protein [Coxiellaceae bacterium]